MSVIDVQEQPVSFLQPKQICHWSRPAHRVDTISDVSDAGMATTYVFERLHIVVRNGQNFGLLADYRLVECECRVRKLIENYHRLHVIRERACEPYDLSASIAAPTIFGCMSSPR